MRVAAWAFAIVGAVPVASAADYVVIRNTVIVEQSADVTWQRVGGYCAIADWLKVTCVLDSGSGDVGSVRRLNGTILEPMVARTPYSYSYWQSQGVMSATAYHGTLAVEPLGKRRSRLIYTLFYDQAALPSDAVRASERARLDTRFVAPLGVMKAMAERR